MKQNNSQIVKEYEAAREAVYSGEILGSEDFEILKEHIGGGTGRNGGYSPDFWTVIGFLMGRKSQESTSSFFDALALDPQPLEDPEHEIERIYCDMFHEGLYRAQNRKLCLDADGRSQRLVIKFQTLRQKLCVQRFEKRVVGHFLLLL